jgi:Asp-tRNA(Asn)/Glu-tRNA(Gln) amidotransferase A subunit family amidase
MFTLETLSAIRAGKTDLRRVIEGFCDTIDESEKALEVFVPGTFDRARVIRQAEELMMMFPDPDSRPPLFGMPAGIKDIFRVDGFLTQCGSVLPPSLFEGIEASSVTRLKRAGCIVFGKTVTSEFAGPEPGPTRNPHNLGHTPGGSSSGSAAGVAAGYFPVALGTQTLGSITRPSAYCGVIGIKPSLKRAAIDGVVRFSESVDHVGVFLSDLSLGRPVLEVIVDDWGDAHAAFSQTRVLGIPEGPYMEQASENALRHFDFVVGKIMDSGLRIQRIPIMVDIHEINDSHRRLITGEIERTHREWFKDYSHLYRPRTREYFEKGKEITEEQLEAARERRLQFRKRIMSTMQDEGIQAWVCPSATDHAPQGLGSTGDPVMSIPWTNIGLPTISLPVGMDQSGLPHGLQVVGAFNEDEALLEIVSELQERLNA